MCGYNVDNNGKWKFGNERRKNRYQHIIRKVLNIKRAS